MSVPSLGLLYLTFLALYRLDKESNLYPEIVSLFRDENAIKMFFLMFGGKTIKVPTLEEFSKILKASYYAYLKFSEGKSQRYISEVMSLTKEEQEGIKELVKKAGLVDELVLREFSW